jgi:hypothetical protein
MCCLNAKSDKFTVGGEVDMPSLVFGPCGLESIAVGRCSEQGRWGPKQGDNHAAPIKCEHSGIVEALFGVVAALNPHCMANFDFKAVGAEIKARGRVATSRMHVYLVV